MGYSGGDMAMTADVSRGLGLTFPAFRPEQAQHFHELLGDRVTIANPFDLHTYIWFDLVRQREVYEYAMSCGFDAVVLMLDCTPESSDLTPFVNAGLSNSWPPPLAVQRYPGRPAGLAAGNHPPPRRVRERCALGPAWFRCKVSVRVWRPSIRLARSVKAGALAHRCACSGLRRHRLSYAP